MKTAFRLGLALAASVAGAMSAQAQDKQQLAFVVNARVRFLEARRGRREEGAGRAARTTSCSSSIPAQATAALQNALMDDLVAAGADAIMVSAVDPKTSTDALQPHRRAGAAVHHRQRRARQSNRIAYIGSSNTDAGKQAGEIALKALPDGGKCMGFVGFLGADNAKERIAGFKQAVEGTKIELVDVRGDDIDFARAKQQRRGRAGRQPRHQLHGRLLFLQHAARSTRR